MKNKKVRNFITTYNHKTWELKNSIYSGKWSYPYEKEKFILKKNIINYHWSNISKKKKDYFYLQKLYEKLLKELAKILNNHHKVKYSLKSWRLLLSPWLISIMTTIFDKYENISIISRKNYNFKTKILNYSVKNFSSINYKDYLLNKFTDDNWHQTIYSDLITKIFFKKFEINKINKECIFKSDNYYNFNLNLKNKIKKLISFKFCLKNNNVFFDTSYINFFDYLKLSFKLNQKPFFSNFFVETSNLFKNNIDINLRKQLSKNFSTSYKNRFEKYLKKNIFYYLPLSYLENFGDYQRNIFDFNFNGTKIISSGEHFSNDLYKHWCCNQIEKGKKHYISFHGGSVPEKYINFEYEYKISEKVIVHNKTCKKNQIKLPVLKKIPKIKYNESSKKILMVTKPSNFKFRYRLSLSPTGSEDLDDFLNIMKFANCLSQKYRDNIYARFLFENWDLKKRFVEVFGNNKIDEYSSYFKSLKKTRIVVASYMSTPFSEALVSNIPSFCLLRKNTWVLDKKFNFLIKEMLNKKILFFSPKKCAEHLNKVYDNIYDWWNLKDTQSVINLYRKHAYYIDKDVINKWKTSIKDL